MMMMMMMIMIIMMMMLAGSSSGGWPTPSHYPSHKQRLTDLPSGDDDGDDNDDDNDDDDRQLRLYAKMTASSATTEAVFRDMETSDKILNELSVTVLGDLGSIFRLESSVSPYESWTGQPLQVCVMCHL